MFSSKQALSINYSRKYLLPLYLWRLNTQSIKPSATQRSCSPAAVTVTPCYLQHLRTCHPSPWDSQKPYVMWDKSLHMGIHRGVDLLSVTGRSFWVLGLLRSILTVLGTVCPADLEQGLQIQQDWPRNLTKMGGVVLSSSLSWWVHF